MRKINIQKKIERDKKRQNPIIMTAQPKTSSRSSVQRILRESATNVTLNVVEEAAAK